MPTPSRLVPLAVLGVLLSGVLVVLTRPASPTRAVEQGVVRVAGPAGSFEVGPRWTRTAPEAVLFYADPSGGFATGLTGPAVADAGYCAGLPTSHRALAGFVAGRSRGDLVPVTRATAARWVAAVSGRSPPRAPRVKPWRLADGTGAVRWSARLPTTRSRDPCVARRVVLDVVGLPSRGAVAVFVLVRDVDPAGVGDAEADRLLAGLQLADPGD